MEVFFNGIFPTIIYTCRFDDHVEFNDKLLKQIYSIKEKEKSWSKSNVGGYHSLGNLSNRKIDIFNELSDRILDVISKMIIEKDYQTYKENSWYPERLESMWFNINNKGHFNVTHMHPGAWLSGAYYVKLTDEDSSHIKLNDPVNCRIYGDNRPNAYKQSVKEGTLILFPAWLQHSVPVNNTEENRISISFNIGKPEYTIKNPLWDKEKSKT